jgi:hypothetical protein
MWVTQCICPRIYDSKPQRLILLLVDGRPKNERQVIPSRTTSGELIGVRLCENPMSMQRRLSPYR